MIEEILKQNIKSINLEKLKHDLVSLGETTEYITALTFAYIDKYFQTPQDALNNETYMNFYNETTEHLLDIVKVKYPKNYEILKIENQLM